VGIFAAGKLVGIGTVAELAARFGEEDAHVEVGFEGTSDPAVAARLEEVLGVIPDVTEVRRGSHALEPWTLVVRPAEAATRVREAVLSVSARDGLRLTSIRSVTASLDEIYSKAVRAAGLSSGSHRPPSKPAAGGKAVA
jgi:hypothetical protein